MQKVALIPGGLDLNNTALRLSDSSTGKFAIHCITNDKHANVYSNFFNLFSGNPTWSIELCTKCKFSSKLENFEQKCKYTSAWKTDGDAESFSGTIWEISISISSAEQCWNFFSAANPGKVWPAVEYFLLSSNRKLNPPDYIASNFPKWVVILG